jgi:hypothetical protein
MINLIGQRCQFIHDAAKIHLKASKNDVVFNLLIKGLDRFKVSSMVPIKKTPVSRSMTFTKGKDRIFLNYEIKIIKVEPLVQQTASFVKFKWYRDLFICWSSSG